MPCYNGKGEKWHGYGTRTSILCRAWDLHGTHPPWMPIFYLQLYIMIFHIKAASSPLSALMFISQFSPLPLPPPACVSDQHVWRGDHWTAFFPWDPQALSRDTRRRRRRRRRAGAPGTVNPLTHHKTWTTYFQWFVFFQFHYWTLLTGMWQVYDVFAPNGLAGSKYWCFSLPCTITAYAQKKRFYVQCEIRLLAQPFVPFDLYMWIVAWGLGTKYHYGCA